MNAGSLIIVQITAGCMCVEAAKAPRTSRTRRSCDLTFGATTTPEHHPMLPQWGSEAFGRSVPPKSVQGNTTSQPIMQDGDHDPRAPTKTTRAPTKAEMGAAGAPLRFFASSFVFWY